MLGRVLVLLAVAAAARAASVAEESTRDGKLFPVVQIVTFENDPCLAANGDTGTCYSQKECSNFGGVASGTCAKGFGVCCVLSATCDSVISVNGTYFTSPNYPAAYSTPGMCMAEIKPPAGTCQILLEFESFNLAGPTDGDCTNDTFVVTGGNAGSNIPILCGHNTGQHIYVHVDNAADAIKLISTISAMPGERHWRIKVIFLDENDPCKAPPFCLQYHKETSGSIMSFNFGPEPMMLTNQAYCICYGYVPGYCDIGFNFNRLDFGRLDGDCSNDYLTLGNEQVCGDFGAFTSQANATGPITTCVHSDDNNERQEEGFMANYMMMKC